MSTTEYYFLAEIILLISFSVVLLACSVVLLFNLGRLRKEIKDEK